jgi:hypothetical protein
MKKLFKNYDFSFDKNERKILVNFSNQIIKQLEMNEGEGSVRDIKTFASIVSKLKSEEVKTKFTKEEKTKLVLNLRENLKHMERQLEKSWFIKKWLIGSVYNQYKDILTTHFSD